MFLTERLAPWGRKDRRHGGGVYRRGLLLDGERQSAGARAARLPEGNQQRLPQFLSQSPWNGKALWQHRAERLVLQLRLGGPQRRINDLEAGRVSEQETTALCTQALASSRRTTATVGLVLQLQLISRTGCGVGSGKTAPWPGVCAATRTKPGLTTAPP